MKEPTAIELHAASGKRQEVYLAAARMRRLAAEGEDAAQMAVVYPKQSGYGPLLQNILPMYGLSAYVAEKRQAGAHPLSRFILSALTAISGNWRLADILECAQSGFLGLSQDEMCIRDSLFQKLFDAFPGQWDRIGHMAILAYDQAHMANMCVAYSHAVNGVSQLHGDILKHTTFADYYSIMPEKFYAITNGITPRRWLMLANPALSELLDETIGQGWRKDLNELEKLLPFADDAAFVEKFAAVKKENKERFSRWIYRHQGIELDPTMMFDVQVKRLHEYKRQLLNALHILVLYNRICDDPNYTMAPRTFIFGAKAAPGYRRAKEIIHFINVLAAKVASHERASKMIKIAFLQNYNVSTAEMLMPASEVSEQLSTASKEASGTGNMKFMMNGAVTIGTLDGANVEIADLVGRDNCYIFGMRSNEVEALYAAGTYRSLDIYETNAELRRALNMMFDGSLTPENPKMFEGLYRALVFSDNGGMADPYLVLKDFGSYQQAQSRLGADYLDQKAWTCLLYTSRCV